MTAVLREYAVLGRVITAAGESLALVLHAGMIGVARDEQGTLVPLSVEATLGQTPRTSGVSALRGWQAEQFEKLRERNGKTVGLEGPWRSMTE